MEVYRLLEFLTAALSAFYVERTVFRSHILSWSATQRLALALAGGGLIYLLAAIGRLDQIVLAISASRSARVEDWFALLLVLGLVGAALSRWVTVRRAQ
jgi:hypothetical protein